LRTIGKGLVAGKKFCAIMNLPRPADKLLLYTQILRKVVKDVAMDSMAQAVEEAVLENSLDCGNENRKLSAGFDGSWQKRGHQSLNGVVSATSIDTGKVLDVAILTKYCDCLDKENHQSNCMANYDGSSGGMEVAGVKQIFQRSIEKYNVVYVVN
jgi:hypothetical protein